MSSQAPPGPRFKVRATLLCLAALALTAAGAVGLIYLLNGQDTAQLPGVPIEATSAQVHQLCGSCHKYPPPDSFPREAWEREVAQGYEFFKQAGHHLHEAPPIQQVIEYYERRAPEKLPVRRPQNASGPPPVQFTRAAHRLPEQKGLPTVSNVNLVHLFDPDKLDVLICDMREGWVSAYRPYLDPPTSVLLGRVGHPAHAEVVDLDGDGIKDVIVADLGKFYEGDDNALVGRVVLLKGGKDGKFTPITLLKGVGRVADVQAADFNGDGKLDLIVAVFGWRTNGSIIYLENRTTDWSKPNFVPHVVDDRHGTIHVPVVDLNKDGKKDFVALISQEHETIVAFLGDGKGRFHKKTIYTAPHPAYGSSGIQLVDLNGDGRLDVLYTNGDVMGTDQLRPQHSIQWLENRGAFPFKHHHLTYMYGVHRALAADYRGEGILDIIAVSAVPEPYFGAEPRRLGLDTVIYLKHVSPGKFVRYSLEKGPDHATCAVGSVHHDGKIDLVTGNFFLKGSDDPRRASITVWKNAGRLKSATQTRRK
jgi:hypothetical protein